MSGGCRTQAASVQSNELGSCSETLRRFSGPAFLLILLVGRSIPLVCGVQDSAGGPSRSRVRQKDLSLKVCLDVASIGACQTLIDTH